MSYRSLAVIGIALLATSARANAQTDETAKPAKKNHAKAAEGEWDDAAKGGDAPEADEGAAPSKAAPAAPEPEAPPAAPLSEVLPPDRPPVYGKRSDWNFSLYGYARLDIIEDSTESFNDGIEPNLIARVGTYKGQHLRSTMTAKDSRLGVFVGAPTYQGIRSSAQIELDFYGLVPTDARQNDVIVFATPRIRHAFLRFETPIVDVVAGQTYDVFGWAPSFFPTTVAYLGVPGQIYHRDPQLRIEKTLHLGGLEVRAAAAAVKAGERDSGIPDFQGGIKLSYNGWKGAAMPGFSRPQLAPLSLGVSGVYRRFEVPAFILNPGWDSATTNGWGFAISALLPIIPVKSIEDHSNALTLTGEFSMGAGIADLYTGMDGGSRFPVLPFPTGQPTVNLYQADADPGLVTFDMNSNLTAIKWNNVVANAQYYLPIGGGRIWLSGTYARTWSPNLLSLTPFTSWGAIFTKMEYIDGNIGFDITPSIVLALSFQTVAQTFGDYTQQEPTYVAQPSISAPTLSTVVPGQPGTGGDAVTARNNRGQLSVALFF
jgi:hypothetical protein